MKHDNILASNEKAFSLADNALAIMDEVVCRVHQMPADKTGTDEATYAWLKQEEGVAMVRSNIIEMSHWFELAWLRTLELVDGAIVFDWELVPALLDYFVEHCDTPADITEAITIAGADAAVKSYLENQS